MVINMIRIAFTQSSSYSELLSKWLSSRSCLKFGGGNDDSNFLRHLVCLSFGRGPCSKMYARVTRDGAKNSTFGYFNGTNPATGKGIQLRSPTPIMAPVRPSEPLLPKQIKERPPPTSFFVGSDHVIRKITILFKASQYNIFKCYLKVKGGGLVTYFFSRCSLINQNGQTSVTAR